MREQRADGDAAVEHDIEEHKEIESTMKRLEGADAAGDEFMSLVRQLEETLSDHVADEESEQFPRLREAVPHAESVEIGDKVEKANRSRRPARTRRRRTPSCSARPWGRAWA
jgi:hemerythrin superfamily protein